MVEEEVRRCRADFEYAARNYFWIANERRQNVLLELKESQQLILDHVLYLKSKGRPQKLILTKARQLGASTLVEALLAWRAMFFANVNCLIVSHDPGHGAFLFGILQHIYDYMPWWLKPMCSSRKIEKGMIFDAEEHDERARLGGLGSRIMVQAANQMTGVGQGLRLNAVHGSEVSEWRQAKEIIEGDMGNALWDLPDTLAILESTAKGINYFYKLWQDSVRLGERANWHPVFLPWFFEKTRVRAPEKGWKVEEPERLMAARAKNDWLRCSACGSYLESPRATAGEMCGRCSGGLLNPVELTRDQMCWMWHRRINTGTDGESLKLLRQEQSSTAEEAFVVMGNQAFPYDAMQFANSTLRHPIAEGFLDAKGNFHGMVQTRTGVHCHQEWCKSDHEHDEKPLKIWEFPRPGYKYTVGADAAEGLGGDHDFSVAVVNRIAPQTGGLDEQVAVWRSNEIDPVSFAYPISFLGRMYNEAVVAVETWGLDSTMAHLKNQIAYPNLWRFRYVDTNDPLSNKLGWRTTQQTKPRLWTYATRWLRQRIWRINDVVTFEEMKAFRKDKNNPLKAEAAEGHHDDTIMASMIALYCSHDGDWDEENSYLPVAAPVPSPEEAAWKMWCESCSSRWGTESPGYFQKCPKCNSRRLRADRNHIDVDAHLKVDIERLGQDDRVSSTYDERVPWDELEAWYTH